MSITFAVSSWSGWTPGVSSEEPEESGLSGISMSQAPDVSSIPPMLRRRLNILGRMAAAQAIPHLSQRGNIPIVYCSRYGDINRTLSVLEQLVADETVSPTHFSLAVHNAVCGVLSIQLGISANITAISAGEEGAIPTLLEAVGQLNHSCREVLCLLCDVSLPEIYRTATESVKAPSAVSFIVSQNERQNEGQALKLALSDERPAPNEFLPLSLVDFLCSNNRNVLIPHNGVSWKLSKC